MIDVYCHTSPSGKRYVGYSKHGMAERWRQHVEAASAGGGYLLHRAIRKYGADSFRHELLEQSDTEAGAKSAERRWIAWRGSMAPAGYNATAGGEGLSGACAEVREKLSASWTPERRAQHSERTRGHSVGNNYGVANKGKARSTEARQRMRAAALAMDPDKRARIDAARAASKADRPPVKYSAESRARMSASQRKRWAERKQVGR
jgi:group I intron endonuclease